MLTTPHLPTQHKLCYQCRLPVPTSSVSSTPPQTPNRSSPITSRLSPSPPPYTPHTTALAVASGSSTVFRPLKHTGPCPNIPWACGTEAVVMAQPSQSTVCVDVCAGSVMVQPNFIVDVTVVVHCACGDVGGGVIEHATPWVRASKPSAGMRRVEMYIVMVWPG